MDAPGRADRATLVETWLSALMLAAMAIIPIAEAVLRPLLGKGIPGAILIVQHLTLCVAFTGASIAADRSSLIALSTGNFLPAGLRRWSSVLTGAAAAAVAAWLALASVGLVRAEREGGGVLALGIPLWLVVALMPVLYAVMALRLVHRASGAWKERAAALALAVLVAVLPWLFSSEGALRPGFAPVALLVLVVLTTFGMPMFAMLGGAAMLLFAREGTPVASVPVETYALATSAIFPAIPLFTLAGYLLSAGSASERLVRVFTAWFGSVRGGTALATALVFAFFTAITGASGVTILSLGGLMLPVLLRTGSSDRFAIGLLTTSGSIGALFPPSLPVILYAVYANIPIAELFAGALIPGIMLVGAVAAWGVYRSPPHGAETHFDRREAFAALWHARWELALPVVILIGVFGGVATLVEASAATVLYVFIVEMVVRRSPEFRRQLRVALRDCAALVGSVLLVLGVALGLTNYVMDAQIPMRGAEWVRAHIESPAAFLLALNLLLIVVGAAMDIYSAILVVVPLILPMGAAFGIDPVHLGVVFLANLQLGYLMPPVGENLFLASSRFGRPLGEIFRGTLPFVVIIAVVVLVITYVPALTTVPLAAFRGR